jgi:glutathione S-transferase
MAINLFLARKYGGEIVPKTLEDEAKTLQYTLWVVNEIEHELLTYGYHTQLLPEEERDPGVAETAKANLTSALRVLDDELADKAYLTGDAFGVVDLNVASVLSWFQFMSFDASAFANVERWLADCMGRPAVARAQAGKSS